MPRRSHPDGEFAEAIERVGGGKGDAVVGANGVGQAKFLEGALKTVKANVSCVVESASQVRR
jgi:hypothetical protein